MSWCHMPEDTAAGREHRGQVSLNVRHSIDVLPE